MKRVFATILLSFVCAMSSRAADAPHARLDEKHRAYFRAYCVECHNEKKQKGKLRLDDISFALDSVENADRWQKILNQINSGEMPPEDAKQPERWAKTEFLDSLSHTLMAARRSLGDAGGKITMRRLNRREYKNTIRHLLGVDLNVRELPADGGAGVFDTVGSSLFMSSDQFEQYLALGRQALDEHFARFVAPSGAKPRRLHIEAEEKNAKVAKSLADRTDAHRRYEKWTAAVSASAQRPENADAVATIRSKKKDDDRYFYSQWQRIKGAPSPKDFGFVDEIHADEQGRRDWARSVPYQRAYLDHPATKTGTFLTIEDVFVNPYQPFRLPGDWPAGDYVVRVRIAATSHTPASRHFVEFGSQHDSGVRAVASSHQVTGTMEKPQVLEIPLKFSPAKGFGFFFQEKGTYESEDVAHRLFAEGQKVNGIGPDFALWIDWIEVESVSDAKLATKAQVFKARTETEVLGNKRMDGLFKHTKEQHANYARWAAAVDAAAARPENLKIAAELREKAKKPRSASGVPYATPLFFYFDWEQIQGAPSPTDFGFQDAQGAFFEENQYVNFFPYYEDYQKLPARDTGAWLLFYQAYRETYVEAGEKWPAGKYTLRMRVAANEAAPRERCFIEFGQRGEDVSQFAVLGAHQVTGTLAQPQIIETTVEVKADGKREFAVRERRPNTRQAEVRSYHDEFEKTGHGPVPAIWIDWLEIEGPVNAAAPSAPALTKTIKERREVELHANAMVGGTYNGYFLGGDKVAKAYLDSDRSKPPSAFGKGIADEQEAKFRVKVFEEHGPSFERYLKDPITKTGAYLTIFNVHPEEVITLPPDQPSGWLKTKHEVEKAEPGEYMLRFRIGAVKGTPKERLFVELGARKDKDDFGLMQAFQISGTTDAPQIIEVPVSISTDGPRTFVLREKRDVKLDHDLYEKTRKETGLGTVPALWIDWVEWEGPMVKQAPIAKVTHIEPETRRAEVERGHLRFKFLNEQYGKWKAAGGDEAKLKDFGFTDKSHAEFAKVVWDSNNHWFQQYLDRPLSKTGLYLDNTVQETSEYAVDLPADAATGDYVMRVKIGRVPDMPAERAFLTFVEASPIDKDDRIFLANKQITATLDQPEVVELPFKVRPGGPRKFVLFEKRPLKKEGISLPGRTRQIADAKQRDPVLWMDWIEYEGPLNKTDKKTSVEPVLFANTTNASEREHARAVIEKFAVRAFRDRPPTEAYLAKLTALYDARRKAGDSLEVALKTPLSVVLASPRFLYLSEPSEEKKPRTLTASELATRLSYFLWSAPPDETLLALARSGELMKPDVLAREVDRMLTSEKADEFVSGFVHQWLGMERLDFFQFDTKQFRDFDESAKAAARREVYETFAHLLRTNGSARDLLKCDYVIVNGLLATYYGIEGVSGDEFRKVSLPKDSPRGGLLGMAAVLAMGSNGERSSPVERGAWVLRKLLHDPPPPAPPNVPQITRLNGKPLTTRERLLAHQEEPQCASCHRAIDPIGFGLENFNAAGKWRTEDSFQAVDANGRPARNSLKTWTIDPAAAFHKGPAFRDYFELRDIIVSRAPAFAHGLTEALIQYALGRPYGFTGEDLATTIGQRALTKDFAMREFIVALVGSNEFRTK